MRLLCLGDSLTFGFALPRGRTWPALAAAQVGLELFNRAVNGNTTGGMLAAFFPEVKAVQPDLVFLMGGGNDILYGRDLAGAKANLGCLAHLTCSLGLVPVIGVPPPVCPPVRRDWMDFIDLERAGRQGEEYAGWLRGLCAAFGFPAVDFARGLPQAAAREGKALRDYYLEDGLHPNLPGHEHMAQIAAQVLAPFGR